MDRPRENPLGGEVEEVREKLRTVLQSLSDAVMEVDASGRILSANRVAEWLPSHDVVGTLVYDERYTPSSSRGPIVEALGRVFGGGGAQHLDLPGYVAPGVLGRFKTLIAPIRLGDRVEKALYIVTDVTEQRRTEASLDRSEALLRLAVETASLGIWEWDIATNRVTWSSRVEAMFGLAPGTFDGRFETYMSMVHPDDRARVTAAIERELKAGGPYSIEHRVVRPDGEVGWVATEGGIVTNDAGDPVLMVGAAIDVTETKRSAEALRVSQETLRSILDTVPDIIMIVDREGTIRYINRTAPGLDANDVVGMCVHDPSLLPPESRELVRRSLRAAFAGGQPEPFEIEAYAGPGRTGWYSNRVVPIRRGGEVVEAMYVARDVTEQRRAEEALRESERRLRHAQKLEAVGQLAGGVAHDFSNYLMAIRGHLEMARRSLGANHPASSPLARAEEATARATGVARSLLTFSEQSDSQMRPVRLDEIVERTMRLIRSMLPSSIETEVGVPEPGVWVEGDEDQLGQVVMNLVLNARDAMPGGGTVRVSVDGDAASARLVVRDTGPGVSAALRERIFDPYFTTKERAEGTGLGLTITHGIVRGHGGTIGIGSGEGGGAVFTVTLPRIREPEAEAAHEGDRGMRRGSRGKALLVEDNELVRSALAAQLGALGFETVEAADGHAAMARFESSRDDLGLVVLDHDLPGRTGESVLAEIRSSGATTPVLVVTGAPELTESSLAGTGARLLAKPFTLGELQAAIDGLLCAPGGDTSSA